MEYKGQLTGFPQEVVEKMLYYQEKQVYKKDITVFEKDNQSGILYKGFDWNTTKEKHKFWKEVIFNKNFDLFFKKYPKTKTNSEVKYFKFELDTLSREALKLINENNKKGVDWGKNKYYYGHSKYYYGSDGTCLKNREKLFYVQIISAKEMIELLSPKKEVEIIDLIMEINYTSGLKQVIRYNNELLINTLKNRSTESVIIKKDDPDFRYFEKIINNSTDSRYKFNQVKELFNK